MCELPDRNSPEDEPDVMVATPAEVRGCIERALDKYCFVIAGAGDDAAPAQSAEPAINVALDVLYKVRPKSSESDYVWVEIRKAREGLSAILAAPQPAQTAEPEAATREVIEPLKEPVSISKALLGGQVARVGGNETETTAFLVNVQLAPWGAPKEWVEGFVDGFNRAAKWMQSAMTDHAVAQPAQTERAQLEAEIARLRTIIHTPESDDFLKGVAIEAEYQRQLHGIDATEARFDWVQYFWVTGYLLNKALAACKSGECNGDKAKHHLITATALISNWHNVLTGRPAACVHSNSGKPVADLIAAQPASGGDA
jgi:hypothetical protein